MDSQEFSGCANEQPKSSTHYSQSFPDRDTSSGFWEAIDAHLSYAASAERDIQNATLHSRQANLATYRSDPQSHASNVDFVNSLVSPRQAIVDREAPPSRNRGVFFF